MTTEQDVERRKNLPAHRLGFINIFWLSLAVGSWCGPALACARNPVYVPPTTKSEAARSHSVVVATLSTYRFLPTPKQSTDSDIHEAQREGAFIVLFTIKGNAKAGDLILVSDSPNDCDAGFQAQFTQGGTDQKSLVATSNTWLLFLSGEEPYKLWESPRSGPLNLFTTDEIRELFVSNAESKER